jgi:hypothetical protein
LKYVLLKNCTTEHLKAILSYAIKIKISPIHERVVKEILEDRRKKALDDLGERA